MPALKNPRHEAFAQAVARGTYYVNAYEDAGFVPDSGHASRLGSRKEVEQRITELIAEQVDVSDANDRHVIAAMLRIAKICEEAGPAGAKEARAALLEARRLCHEWREDQLSRII